MGVSKTMQEIDDEIREREDVARESALQAQMAEAQQQQEMEGEEEGGQREEDDDEEGGVLGRDLDEDIPDADQEGGWVDDDDDGDSGLSSEENDENYDDEEEDDDDGGNVSQQQGVFSVRPHGAAVELYGEYVVDQGGDDYDGGRDLDEDIPEGGSYQHTDTEVEDESSFDGEEGMSGGFGIGIGLLQQQERR